MRYPGSVRTTLDLDDDLLEVAKRLAAQRRSTIGRVVSDLTRRALAPVRFPKTRNGVLLFSPKPGARKPNLDLINQLRDQP